MRYFISGIVFEQKDVCITVAFGIYNRPPTRDGNLQFKQSVPKYNFAENTMVPLVWSKLNSQALKKLPKVEAAVENHP